MKKITLVLTLGLQLFTIKVTALEIINERSVGVIYYITPIDDKSFVTNPMPQMIYALGSLHTKEKQSWTVDEQLNYPKYVSVLIQDQVGNELTRCEPHKIVNEGSRVVIGGEAHEEPTCKVISH